VTAVIVGHDGAGWLAHGLDALQEQTRPVQRVVAVDTGSRDRSGAVLSGRLGQAAVFGMDRSTGYAAAVRRALQHKTASGPVPAAAGTAARGRQEQTEWIWLLHDDCEPAADALEQLLRGAAETPSAGVLGPKLMDWTDRDVVLETGISLDTVGRRITGIEPREVDQGQHDGDRDVLAVSSAGMLIRRDVWEQVGGFDPGMALFGEDIDLCWRVHAAGFRVRVITDAVVYHALAATRGRRPISVGRRARLLDRRNGLLTLLGNLPTGPMIISLLANLSISLLRTIFYTVAKRGTAALDEAAALLGVVGHPMRFAAARRRRARGRRAAYSRVRGDLPAGHSLRRAAEFAALVLTRSAKSELASGHSATDDPTDDDSMLTDSGFLQRFVTRPGVLMLTALIVVTAVAEHALIGGGPLGGGALLPAWEGASTLWGEVLQAFHPVGIGSASAAPPSAGFVALLATVLLGKTWLAVDVLLLGCVPLAGVTALLALRKVTGSAPVRVWAAASYALLPVAFGAVAAGRLGSAVAFVLIPLIGLAAGRMFTESARLARRAAWATGFIVMIGTAFVPVLWPMAVVAVVIAAVVVRRSRPMLLNLLIVAATPVVLLLPWMLQLLAHPSTLLLEAGVQQPGLATPGLPARSLLLLSPGGPGLPPYWVSAALVLVALAALASSRRRVLVMSGWGVALLGLAAAVAMSRATVTPAGGQAMTPWPGAALAVAAAGMLLAAAAAADGLGRSLGSRDRKGLRRLSGVRGLAAAVGGLAAISAPVLAAGYWLAHQVPGPVAPAVGQVVPALAPISGSAGRQLRTLVLSSAGGHVSYLLLRGGSPQFADPGLVPASPAQSALSDAVAALVAPSGGLASDQSQQLARFDIGFVLMRAPANPQLVSLLNSVSGLTAVSMTPSFDLWKLTTLPARVTVVEPSGAVVPVSSGPIGVSVAAAPAAGGILELAEPAGGWHAALNGHGLTPVASPAGSWAQAFRLPAGGGALTVSRNGLLHDLVTAIELLAIAVVAVLALPGVRTAAEIEAAAAAGASRDQDAREPTEPAPGDARVAGAGPGIPGRPGIPARLGRGRAGALRRTGRPRRGKTAAEARPGRTTAGRDRGLADTGTGRPSRDANAGADQLSQDAAAGAGRLAPGAGAGRAGRLRRPGADSEPEQARRPGRRRAAAAAEDTVAEPAGRPASGRSLRGAASRAAAIRPGRGGASAADAAAAGAAAAGVAAAGLAGAAAGRSAGDAGHAAWPAGQPASRFISDPPESRSSGPGTDQGSWPPGDPQAARWGPDQAAGRPARRAGLSPSGSAFDESTGQAGPLPSARHERYGDDTGPPRTNPRRGHGEAPPGRRYEDPDRYPGSAGYGRSPSGSPYPQEPAYRADSGRDRRSDPAADWPPQGQQPDSGRDRGSGPADWRPRGQQPDSGRDRGSGPADWRPRGQQPDSGGWRTAEDSSWGDAGRSSAWPEPRRTASWPQDQRDWAPEHSGGAPPDQAAELEALPPAGEVHHDWPSRADRHSRGWITPGDEDADGEAW